jgi:hypothetical protein
VIVSFAAGRPNLLPNAARSLRMSVKLGPRAVRELGHHHGLALAGLSRGAAAPALPRLCQGCSCPPRHHPDQAAPSFPALLRQDGGEGLSPPLEMTGLTAQT